MARFEVFENPSGQGALLDVQADLLDGLNTRVVMPLMVEKDAPRPAKRLNLVFEIDGERYVMGNAIPRRRASVYAQNPDSGAL